MYLRIRKYGRICRQLVVFYLQTKFCLQTLQSSSTQSADFFLFADWDEVKKFIDIVFANHIQKFADFFLSFTNIMTAHPQTQKYPFEKTKTAFADWCVLIYRHDLSVWRHERSTATSTSANHVQQDCVCKRTNLWLCKLQHLQTIHTYLQTKTAVCKFWHFICRQE